MGIVIRMSRPRSRPFKARMAKGGRPVVVDQKGGFIFPLLAGLAGTVLSKFLK